MSESRTKLEEILELLLAEENEKAEEALHEYVVAKARAEYEKVLDEDSSDSEEVEETVEEAEESEEEAVEEAEESEEEAVEEEFEVDEVIDQSNDFEDDILRDNEEEIDGDEMGEEEGEGDLEDKVDDLEDELEDLKAEFEKLLADEEGGEGDDAEELEMDMEDEMEMGDEMDMESVEYDLDEATDEDEVVEEATKLSDNVAEPKGGEADNSESPLSKSPKKNFKVDGVKGGIDNKDGGEGNKGDNKPKDHTPTDNINVEPKKA